VTGDRTVGTRSAGLEFVFVVIDDRTRLGWSGIHPDERATRVVAFLQAALASTGGSAFALRGS
jgi:hypothetical protein